MARDLFANEPLLKGKDLLEEKPQRKISLVDILKPAVTAAQTPLTGSGLRTPTALGVGQGALQALTLGMGIPVLRKLVGPEASAQVRPPTTKEAVVGGLLGTVAGGLTTPGQAIARTLARGGTLARTAKGALVGAAFNPSNVNIVAEPEQRAVQAAVAAAVPAVAGAISKTAKLVRGFKNITNKPKFARNVRNTFLNGAKEAGDEFDKTFTKIADANPGNKIDLRDEFIFFKQTLDDPGNPGLKADIRSIIRKIKDPNTAKTFQELLDNPDVASGMTLDFSQKLKRAINSVPSIARKLKKGRFADWTPAEAELLDLSTNIRNKQISFNPEVEKTFANYKSFINDHNQVKSLFRVGKLLKNVERNFGDAEIQEVVKRLLPTRVLNEIGDFQTATKLLQGMGVLGKGIAVTGAIAGAAAVGGGIGARIASRTAGGGR